MKLRYFQVDAFAARAFEGNPAGVCQLEDWLPDELMQAIAAENNLSETAFFVPVEGGFHLRWFTPLVEVDLCGHATLATAHALFMELGHHDASVRFQTRSGWLSAAKRDDLIELDFPAKPAAPVEPPSKLIEALGREPYSVLKTTDYLAVFDREEDVAALSPDMKLLSKLDSRGIIVTAPGEDFDFVSRFFAPQKGIPEDPVTGSAHCTLMPYWVQRIGKTTLQARQISRRGGTLHCRLEGDRVFLAGQAVTYSRADLRIPDPH